MPGWIPFLAKDHNKLSPSLAALQDTHTTLGKHLQSPHKNQKSIVEALRKLAELLLYGDKHDPTFFEYFLEKNCIASLWTLLKHPLAPQPVKVQLLQTLSLLLQNLRQGPSVYYILSNDHINELIRYPFDFSDEELLSQYVSLVKSIAVRLDKATVQFFIFEEEVEKQEQKEAADARTSTSTTTRHFALFEACLTLWTNEERMVRTAVRTAILSVCGICDDAVQSYVIQSPALSGLVAATFRATHERLTEAIRRGDSSAADDALQRVLDEMYFFSDLLEAAREPLANLLGSAFLKLYFISHCVKPLVGPHEVGPRDVEAFGEGAPQAVVEGAPENFVESGPKQIVEGAPQDVIQSAPKNLVENAPISVEGAPTTAPNFVAVAALLMSALWLTTSSHTPLVEAVATILLHPRLNLRSMEFPAAQRWKLFIRDDGPPRNKMRCALAEAMSGEDELLAMLASAIFLAVVRSKQISRSFLLQAEMMPLREVRSNGLLEKLLITPSKEGSEGGGGSMTTTMAPEESFIENGDYSQDIVRSLLKLIEHQSRFLLGGVAAPAHDAFALATRGQIGITRAGGVTRGGGVAGDGNSCGGGGGCQGATSGGGDPGATSGCGGGQGACGGQGGTSTSGGQGGGYKGGGIIRQGRAAVEGPRLVVTQVAVELLLELLHGSGTVKTLLAPDAQQLLHARRAAASAIRAWAKLLGVDTVAKLLEYERRQLPLPLTNALNLHKLLCDVRLLLPNNSRAAPLARRAPMDHMEHSRVALHVFLLISHARNLLQSLPDELVGLVSYLPQKLCNQTHIAIPNKSTLSPILLHLPRGVAPTKCRLLIAAATHLPHDEQAKDQWMADHLIIVDDTSVDLPPPPPHSLDVAPGGGTSSGGHRITSNPNASSSDTTASSSNSSAATPSKAVPIRISPLQTNDSSDDESMALEQRRALATKDKPMGAILLLAVPLAAVHVEAAIGVAGARMLRVRLTYALSPKDVRGIMCATLLSRMQQPTSNNSSPLVFTIDFGVNNDKVFDVAHSEITRQSASLCASQQTALLRLMSQGD